MTASERPGRDSGGSRPGARTGAVKDAGPVALAVPQAPQRGDRPKPTPAAKKARRHRRIALLAVLALVLSGVGTAIGIYYVDSVPTPAELALPESTTVYYADGRTPMARLGVENRTILTYADMNPAVKQAIVAAEDRTFWSNPGIDFRAVLRAAWNNVTGGHTQGASTITQQYARIAADLKGVTFSRKTREAVMAWKLDKKYSKEQILEFYLNTVPFGRGAYGIEAAAQAYLDKSANVNAPPASQVSVAEAMVLAAMVKQPEANPDDPEGQPGYDPTRGPKALENSRARWNYIRDGMVDLGYLSREQAAALTYPTTVKPFDPASRQSGLDRPTGLVVSQALAELRQAEPFKGRPADYIGNGGFRIVTTVDKRAQDVAENAADIRRPTTPEPLRGQPATWQAALVAVEPGSGRVLAYYGGSQGTSADYAGWHLDATGAAVGFGAHPPGSSFKVYDLAEAIRQKISPKSRWDSPAVKEFPRSGRTNNSPAGPIRNASTAPCQPNCTLWEATAASLNVTFFDLTERIGYANVIDMAIKSGVDALWTTTPDRPEPTRVDLRGKQGKDVAGQFSTEVGIGQYPVTVLDHANGMATFAADGRRAGAHFVREVTKNGERVYAEKLTQTPTVLDQEQINELDWTLGKVDAAKLDNGWDAAGKTGTWQYGQTTTRNAHTWMVGYTRALAAAVWLGTTDGSPLVTRTGSYEVYGAGYPGPIWRQFMTQATEAMKLDPAKRKFAAPAFPADASPSSGTTPSQAPTSPPATQPTRPPPTPQPTCQPPTCPRPSPSTSPSPTPPALPSPTARRRAGKLIAARR